MPRLPFPWMVSLRIRQAGKPKPGRKRVTRSSRRKEKMIEGCRKQKRLEQTGLMPVTGQAGS
jgi:hypothetical protein